MDKTAFRKKLKLRRKTILSSGPGLGSSWKKYPPAPRSYRLGTFHSQTVKKCSWFRQYRGWSWCSVGCWLNCYFCSCCEKSDISSWWSGRSRCPAAATAVWAGARSDGGGSGLGDAARQSGRLTAPPAATASPRGVSQVQQTWFHMWIFYILPLYPP